jgi:putative ABC transport system permease protein
VLAGRISISLEGGSSRETQLLGVSPQYRFIRNLVVSEGRFFDELDEAGHLKCAVVTESLARQRFGSAHDAIGQELIIKRVPFTIIGVFRESVSDFGQSEIALDTVLVPYAEARFFTGTDQVSQIYFSMRSMNDVPEATRAIKTILTVRHGLDFLYATQDLGDVLEMAARISDIVTVVLILVAAVTLVVGGVGIMNIMLANVQARTHEIGLRKALGATFREIRFQFLSESVIISLAGGIVGCIAGLALPVSVRLFTDYDLPINLWSVGIALAAAALTGVLFGTLPATRAAHLDPVDSLRYE